MGDSIMPIDQMKQLLDSMETSVKMQQQARAERRAEEAQSRTVCDAVQAGYGQYENDPLHEMQAVGCESVTSDGTYRCAKAGGYFCYDLAVERDKKNVLSVCLCGEDGGKPLKITAGGETLFDGRLAAFDERL